jgi:chemotaxis response regulator CheB
LIRIYSIYILLLSSGDVVNRIWHRKCLLPRYHRRSLPPSPGLYVQPIFYIRPSKSISMLNQAVKDDGRTYGWTMSPPLAHADASQDSLENLIVIGSSYGGIDAIEYLLPELDLSYSAAILIPHIQNSAIYWLLRDKSLDVVGVERDHTLRSGKIYIPGHSHDTMSEFGAGIEIHPGYICVVPPPGRRSITHVMSEAARSYGERSIGVLLSGYGMDGKRGAENMKRHGGKVMAQLEDGSAADGYAAERYIPEMPLSVIGSIEVDFKGPLPKLAEALNCYLSKSHADRAAA